MNKIKLAGWTIKTTVQHAPPPGCVFAKQTHSRKIAKAADITNGITEADGIIVQSSGETAVIRTADCLPLIITTPDVALALHVSRKSLLAGLLDTAKNCVEMNSVNGVYIGPHICADHFTFEYQGSEVASFIKRYPYASTGSKPAHLSLIAVVERRLQEWGIDNSLRHYDKRCTYEQDDLPSWKRQHQNEPLTTHLFTLVQKFSL